MARRVTSTTISMSRRPFILTGGRAHEFPVGQPCKFAALLPRPGKSYDCCWDFKPIIWLNHYFCKVSWHSRDMPDFLIACPRWVRWTWTGEAPIFKCMLPTHKWGTSWPDILLMIWKRSLAEIGASSTLLARYRHARPTLRGSWSLKSLTR